MNQHIINVYPIQGLEAFSQAYRLADVIGLDRAQLDYFRSVDRLTSLSRTLRKPITFLDRPTGPVIVFPEGALVPTTVEVGGRILTLRPHADSFEIDFSKSTEFDPMRLRIVRFAVEGHFKRLLSVWQPSPGQAFFQKHPGKIERGAGLFFGTRIRPMVLHDGRIGLCIDKTSRLISTSPLPLFLTREEFEDRWKGQRCVYRYGDVWYEIRAEMLARQPVSQYPIRQPSGITTLHAFLLDNIDKPVPKEIANLDPSGAVIIYRNSRGEERAAPAQLCFPIRDTEDLRQTGLGKETILEPDDRLDWSTAVAKQLASIPLAGRSISVLPEPQKINAVRLNIPDLAFGHNKVLSVKRSPNSHHVDLRDLGKTRVELLESPSAGLLVKNKLDRQYLILPKTAAASFGDAFVSDLVATMKRLHPDGGYKPILITYDDTGRRTFAEQARAVREALKQIALPGFAVVMIHRCKTRKRNEDALAAYVLRRFAQDTDTIASVIHYDSSEQLYEPINSSNGGRIYRIRPDRRGRARGYFRHVALNKILLTNQNWPFGLAEPLHADLTIGIDIKNNACCLLTVCEKGRRISSHVHVSKQQEKLNEAQLFNYLIRVIGDEAQRASNPITRIVIHRDGRAWNTEISGANRAVERLKAKGVLPSHASLAVLEFHKRSSIPLRVFEIRDSGDSRDVLKPSIGKAYISNESEVFICTTGRPFLRPGTPNPLQVQRVFGSLPILDCAEDVFALSSLTWTKPDDCLRYPITLRLADRFLADEASEYNEDELAFGAANEVIEEETA